MSQTMDDLHLNNARFPLISQISIASIIELHMQRASSSKPFMAFFLNIHRNNSNAVKQRDSINFYLAQLPIASNHIGSCV
jgi:hypothetical protein